MVGHPPILLKESFIFFILQIVELIKVFVFEPIFIGLLSGLSESFLDEWCGRGRLLWNNAMFAEDVIPASDKISACQLFRLTPHHSVSALGLSTGTFIGISMFALWYCSGANSWKQF